MKKPINGKEMGGKAPCEKKRGTKKSARAKRRHKGKEK